MQGPCLNISGLSIQKTVLFYEQLMHPLMDYVYLIWWSITHTHIRNLQVLHCKCASIVINAPCTHILVTRKFTMIWRLQFLLTTSGH